MARNLALVNMISDALQSVEEKQCPNWKWNKSPPFFSSPSRRGQLFPGFYHPEKTNSQTDAGTSLSPGDFRGIANFLSLSQVHPGND